MLKTSLGVVWRGFNLMTRIALIIAAVFLLAAGSVTLTLRYWILPNIEGFHDKITASVSDAIGQPVTVGRIEADWSGLRPHLALSDVRVLDRNKPGAAALALSHVDAVVSWTSFIRAELRLYSLILSGPDLQVSRDKDGQLHVAGVALSSEATGKSGFADWLLHQKYLVVNNARITWLDEGRANVPLVFDRVNLFVQNGFIRHRFAVRATPPTGLSGELDVRGDFTGETFEDLSKWRGEVFTQLDYADVGAWGAWVPLPPQFKRGKGALRGWLAVSDGKMSGLTADLALADVEAQLAPDLQPMDVQALKGRVGWQKTEQGFEVSTQNLSLHMVNGLALPPTDFSLRLDRDANGQYSGGEMRANTLEVADLANLAGTLPLTQELKKGLADFAPHGKISGLHAKWQSDGARLAHYEINARFEELSLQKTESVPGFSGMTGEINGSDSGGNVTLKPHRITLDAPQYMPEPLAFDNFSAQGSWQKTAQGMLVKFGNVTASNADLSGTVYGSFESRQNAPGIIDLNINLPHALIRHADRYIPVTALDAGTHAWLKNALQGGVAEDFHLRLQGDLNDFPFVNGKKGAFQILAHIKGGALEYDKDWPRIENIAAELRVQGKQLEVISQSAMTAGVRIQKADVVIPDTTLAVPILQVKGETLGDTARAFEFIRKSPVRGYIDGITDGMKASGQGSLHLSVNVPLAGRKPPTVSGSYRFMDNDIDLGSYSPVLHKANGELFFTEAGMHVKDATARILGGPATLSVQSSANGSIDASAHGRTDMDALSRMVSNALLPNLHGGSAWDAEFRMQNRQSNILVTSDLAGLSSDLPAPFNKTANEAVPLRFEMRSPADNRDIIAVQYGKLVNARFLRREENGTVAIRRGTVNFGGQGRWVNREGVWITGVVPQFSLEGWGGLFGATNEHAVSKEMPFTVAGADVTIQKLDAFGHDIEELHINARNRGDSYVADISSRTTNGELSWLPQGKGKLIARLKNLSLGEKAGTPRTPEKKEEVARHITEFEKVTRTEFPALDLSVEELAWKDKHLGRAELLASQHGREWQLELMRLANPDGILTADGKYRMVNGRPETHINMKLEISDAGRVLGRFGYPDSVRKGSGKLEGDFSWPGAPDDFTYSALEGNLKLDTDKGQFLKIETGAGKLLGVLSLQALPKHIALDFTDVFSDGFAFDSITGTAQIKDGILASNDFRIEGSSAKVNMTGQVDIIRETQNLHVRILPTVGNSVSLLGALVGGPVVGLGTFLANKILREPLDKLVSFEYNITGTWASPNVVKVGQKKVDKPEEMQP